MKNEKLSDFFQHLAWGIIGQECDCGSNPFNGLARLMNKPVNDPAHWNDDCEPTGLVARCACALSDKVRYVAESLMPDFETGDFVEHVNFDEDGYEDNF